MIPVEAVAATTKVAGKDYAQRWYAPNGGTVASFQAADTSQPYIYYIVYLSKDITAEAIICMQNEKVKDYFKDHAKDMTVSAIAEAVGTITDSKIAEKTVKFILDFSLWAISKAEVKSMIKARDDSADKKIMVQKWCGGPPYYLTTKTFEAWEGDYVDDTWFGAICCIPGTSRTFDAGVYWGYEAYK